MELPYTATPLDAFMAAQTAVGAGLTAVIWRRPLRPVVASITLLGAIWLAILAPVADQALAAIGQKVPSGSILPILQIAAALATLAMAIHRPRWIAAVAGAGQLSLMWMGNRVIHSDRELAGLHVFWFAVLMALHLRANFAAERPREPVTPDRSYLRGDLLLGAAAFVLACVVCIFVLERTCDSADEWAYHWQALVFARFKAYAAIPPCPDPHRAHWVFYWHDHAFGMYLPGWPLFLAPFARLHIAWLASPVCFALMVVGVARVGRRAGGEAAGVIAALSAMLGAATLMNAASRYCHIYVAACFIWAVEAVCANRADTPHRQQWAWGVVLGLTTSLALCTRPQDAGLLCFGLFLVFVHGLFKRTIGWRVVGGAAPAFVLVCGLTLIILHAQLGVWFKTGYDIAPTFYWWTKGVYDVPARDAWKYGLPFMTISYAYFPCVPAFAVAGLSFLGRRLGFILGSASVLLLGFYTAAAFGRYRDFGYGPRYHLALIVPMAIGGGVLLAPLWRAYRARRTAPILGTPEGPAVLAFAAMLLALLRIAPMMYPYAHDQLHLRSAIFRAIEREHLSNAIVTVAEGATGGGPLLDAQNDPMDPNASVIIIGPQDLACTRELYSQRKFYRATGREEVTLTPY